MSSKQLSEEQFFHVARKISDHAARDAYLDHVCQEDRPMRERIRSLLDAHEGTDDLMNSRLGVAVHSGKTDLFDRKAEDQVGNMVGPYKLLEELGEGGFGTVWAAEQKQPMKRRVALKLIKAGMDTRHVIARFEAERQALALLDHPNIAKVLDAGSTQSGRPYFVMELVRGIRITDYCDENRLAPRERLELIVSVCHAVQHAHQKGIIHRDLKPSNILITLHDGVPVPKVIDFGIAKATQFELTEKTIYTQLHQFIGTPDYVSPEQAEMSGLDIDTRSDVYSLGVLLYELLVGRPPFDTRQIMASGIDEVRRVIRTQEPFKPSSKLSSLEQDQRTATAQRCGMDPPRLTRVIRGDLDWIALKCLEKDRARRYDTANALALDIGRYLNDEPILAHPPSKAYRLRKLIRQHRLFVCATVVVAIILVLASVISIGQAVRAKNAERVQSQLREEADILAQNEFQLRKDAESTASHLRKLAYSTEVNLAFRALEENNLALAKDLLARQLPKPGNEDLRGFEWRYLWEICQSDEVRTLSGQFESIRFSPDGRVVVTAGQDFSEIRDANTYKVVKRISHPGRHAGMASFSQDGELLSLATNDGVELRETNNWTLVRELPGTFPGKFSPDGQYFVAAQDDGYRVWDTSAWTSVGDISGSAIYPWHARKAMSFSPDNRYLVAGLYTDGVDDDWIGVWELPSLKRVDGFAYHGGGMITSSAFLPGENPQLLLGNWDGEVSVWDVKTGEHLKDFGNHDAWISEIVVSPDAKLFATASSDRVIQIWNARTFSLAGALRGHVAEIWSLDWSVDGRLLTGANDGLLKDWSTPESRNDVLEGIDGFRITALTSDSKSLVTIGKNGACITQLDTATSTPIPLGLDWKVESYQFKDFRLASHGTKPILVVGKPEGDVEIWDGSIPARVAKWRAHDGPTDFVAISDNGKRIATGSRDGNVAVWDYETQNRIAHFPDLEMEVFHLALSPDGSSLAASVGHENASYVGPTNVVVWHINKVPTATQLIGHRQAIMLSAFSPDSRTLATASSDNTAGIWDVKSGELLARLEGHVSGLFRVVFSPDGKTIATAAGDKKVKLWSTATFQELASFSLNGVYSMEFSKDGSIFAIGFYEGTDFKIRLLRAPSFTEIDDMSNFSK